MNDTTSSYFFLDRLNEYSDEDEDQDFSSNEDNCDDRLYKRSYNSKRSNYTKMGLPLDADADDGNPKHDAESEPESELENYASKEKGVRAKINRVKIRNFIFF